MTYPSSDVSTTDMDAGTDVPATARSSILDLAQKFNLLRNFITTIGQAIISAGNAGAARTAIGAAASGANTDITSMTGLSNGGIPVAKVSGAAVAGALGSSGITGAAASGANTDITSLGGVLVGNGAGSVASNTRYGSGALVANTIGINQVAIGFEALKSIVNNSNSTAVGCQALRLTTGSTNSAFGAYSGSHLTSGTDNTFIGCQAGEYATGSANTFVGGLTGGSVTGSNNTAIGYGADAASSSSANSVTLGNSSITALRCAATSISSLSDARDKTDVVDLPCGLSFINTLRPIKFTWAMRDGAKVGIPDFGFIAQELKAAQEAAGAKDWLNLVSEENPEKLEASYGRLLPVMVKALQELSAKVAALEARP